jgi:hypothetical protein
MKNTLDIVLLLALPASGKSEVRRYLAHQTPETCKNDFHMGPTVQLDDFPYVHIMRRADDECAKLGKGRMFFASGDKPFINPLDWGTLLELVNEDYADLLGKKAYSSDSCAEQLIARIDRASKKVGAPERFAQLDADTRKKLCAILEPETKELLKEKLASYTDLNGKTLVIEFARGGAQGSPLPLKAPFGYQYSLGILSREILEKAVILFIWVTPEESRRKNSARANPDDPGSILHHGVPMEVMLNDYGVDDMDWLEQHSEKPGTVTVKAHGKTWHLPIARFDNRVDKTSFLRAEQKDWAPASVKAVRDGIKGAMDKLFAFVSGK